MSAEHDAPYENVRARPSIGPVRHPPLLELWHIGETRCFLTPSDGQSPFEVALFHGAALSSQQKFESHTDAVICAVEALRHATQPGN
jgi:hypothetical protein